MNVALNNRTKAPMPDALSFVRRNRNGGGLNYWADVPHGVNYDADCETGKRLAQEFCNFLAEHPTYGNGSLLSLIVGSMEANAATKGHRVGFLNTVNRFAMAGAHLSQDRKVPEEKPVDKANRLAFELAETLNTYLDGRAMAAVFPTSVRPEFPVGFMFLNQHHAPDPLLDAIKDAREKSAKLEAMEDEITPENEQALVEEYFSEPLNRLDKWNSPATTRAGAVEALKFVLEYEESADPLVHAMIRAAVAYLESAEWVAA